MLLLYLNLHNWGYYPVLSRCPLLIVNSVCVVSKRWLRRMTVLDRSVATWRSEHGFCGAPSVVSSGLFTNEIQSDSWMFPRRYLSHFRNFFDFWPSLFTQIISSLSFSCPTPLQSWYPKIDEVPHSLSNPVSLALRERVGCRQSLTPHLHVVTCTRSAFLRPFRESRVMRGSLSGRLYILWKPLLPCDIAIFLNIKIEVNRCNGNMYIHYYKESRKIIKIKFWTLFARARFSCERHYTYTVVHVQNNCACNILQADRNVPKLYGNYDLHAKF